MRPAVNIGLSVSRVGSSAQTKAMKKVAGRLRLELAQFRELASFAQFASDLDESTKKRITRGRVLSEILKQPELNPVPFEDQVVLIYAGTNGYLDHVAPEEVSLKISALLDYIKKLYGEAVLKKIGETGELGEEAENSLKKALEEFKNL